MGKNNQYQPKTAATATKVEKPVTAPIVIDEAAESPAVKEPAKEELVVTQQEDFLKEPEVEPKVDVVRPSAPEKKEMLTGIVKAANTDSESNVVTLFKQQLAEYVAAMDVKKPQSESSILGSQTKLLSLMRGLLNADYADARVMTEHLILVVQDQRRSVFSERYLFRGIGTIRCTKDEGRQFLKFLDIIQVVADRKDGESLARKIDMERMVEVFGESFEKINNLFNLSN